MASPKAATDLAVVIVGYNHRSYLEECFASLKASTYRSFNVFFVDNASKDGSAEFVRKHHPEITLIEAGGNLGFAGGNNLAIAEALRQDFPYLLLLNPDTVLAPDCLGALMKEAKPDLVLQPLILLHRDGQPTELVNTAGNSLNYLGFSYCGSYLDPAADHAADTSITLASGAAVLFPAPALRTIGLFDELFFIYHEDVDLSWRARMAGYDIRLVAAARLWHKYSFSRNATKLFYSERNRLLFMLKNYSLGLLVCLAPSFVLNELLVCLYALVSGWLPAKLRSYGQVARLLPEIGRKRRQLAPLRKRSDHELAPFLSSRLGFSEMKLPLIEVYNFLSYLNWSLIQLII